MFIAGLGTAVPSTLYTQRQCWEALTHSAQVASLSGRSKAILKKVLLGDNGISTRGLSLDDLGHAFDLSPDILHERFATAAPKLATQAAVKALHDAGRAASEIDGLLISTCTGYLCPGLTSYVSEALGLSANAFTLDLVGQGCGAAIPNLATAESLLKSERCKAVLSICVEVCSAAFYLDNDPGVLISACLFGDGAGAAVLTEEPGPGRSIEWLISSTHLNPKERNLLRFEQKGGMLRNVLDKSVPLLVVEQNRTVLGDVITKLGLPKSEIACWIVHSGGRDVLAALQAGLELAEDDLRWSAAVLRENGNVSSPSVLFALEKALKAGASGGFWYLSAFGAGITCHGAMLRVI
jgi:polyketide synthase Type III